MARAVMYAIQAVLMKAPVYAVSIAIDLLIVFLAGRLYKKHREKFRYDNIVLSGDVKQEFDIYCDRYKKRLVNAFFILLVLLVNCSGILERAIVANMSADELIVLMCGNVDILAAAVFILLYHTFITHAVLNGVCGHCT